MKGIVFTEFLDFVEKVFGEDSADAIIEKSNLESGGSYTAVGLYDYREMITLVTELSLHTQHSAPDLLKAFGHNMLCRFTHLYPALFKQSSNLFQFLGSVDHQIHVEVRKLYPDAELPKFATIERSNDHIVMDYHSCRAMGAFAEGLIAGAAEHYLTNIVLTITSLDPNNGTALRFDVRKRQ